jgi:hypothetical protein
MHPHLSLADAMMIAYMEFVPGGIHGVIHATVRYSRIKFPKQPAGCRHNLGRRFFEARGLLLVLLLKHPDSHRACRRSMRSMSGGLFPAVEGPCKSYAMAPTRMSGHNCLLGPPLADGLFPGGKPHEHNERFHG